MIIKKSALLFLILFLIIFIFMMKFSSAETITVCDSGCSYTSIQEAIDNSHAGDTILVKSPPLEYTNDLTISKKKNIIIKGDDLANGGKIRLKPNENNIITCKDSNDITISNFEFYGTSGKCNGNIYICHGIYMDNCHNMTIENNWFRKITFPMNDNNRWKGGYAVGMVRSNNNKIINNLVEEIGWESINLADSNNNLIKNNTIRKIDDHGIKISGGVSNIIEGNDISQSVPEQDIPTKTWHNYPLIYLIATDSTIVSNNTLHDNGKDSSYVTAEGIRVRCSKNTQIINNMIVGVTGTAIELNNDDDEGDNWACNHRQLKNQNLLVSSNVISRENLKITSVQDVRVIATDGLVFSNNKVTGTQLAKQRDLFNIFVMQDGDIKSSNILIDRNEFTNNFMNVGLVNCTTCTVSNNNKMKYNQNIASVAATSSGESNIFINNSFSGNINNYILLGKGFTIQNQKFSDSKFSDVIFDSGNAVQKYFNNGSVDIVNTDHEIVDIINPKNIQIICDTNSCRFSLKGLKGAELQSNGLYVDGLAGAEKIEVRVKEWIQSLFDKEHSLIWTASSTNNADVVFRLDKSYSSAYSGKKFVVTAKDDSTGMPLPIPPNTDPTKPYEILIDNADKIINFTYKFNTNNQKVRFEAKIIDAGASLPPPTGPGHNQIIPILPPESTGFTTILNIVNPYRARFTITLFEYNQAGNFVTSQNVEMNPLERKAIPLSQLMPMSDTGFIIASINNMADSDDIIIDAIYVNSKEMVSIPATKDDTISSISPSNGYITRQNYNPLDNKTILLFDNIVAQQPGFDNFIIITNSIFRNYQHITLKFFDANGTVQTYSETINPPQHRGAVARMYTKSLSGIFNIPTGGGYLIAEIDVPYAKGMAATLFNDEMILENAYTYKNESELANDNKKTLIFPVYQMNGTITTFLKMNNIGSSGSSLSFSQFNDNGFSLGKSYSNIQKNSQIIKSDLTQNSWLMVHSDNSNLLGNAYYFMTDRGAQEIVSRPAIYNNEVYNLFSEKPPTISGETTFLVPFVDSQQNGNFVITNPIPKEPIYKEVSDEFEIIENVPGFFPAGLYRSVKYNEPINISFYLIDSSGTPQGSYSILINNFNNSAGETAPRLIKSLQELFPYFRGQGYLIVSINKPDSIVEYYSMFNQGNNQILYTIEAREISNCRLANVC